MLRQEFPRILIPFGSACEKLHGTHQDSHSADCGRVLERQNLQGIFPVEFQFLAMVQFQCS